MSKLSEQLYHEFINDIETQRRFTNLNTLLLDTGDVANMDFSDLQGGSLDSIEDFLEPFKIPEDCSNILTPNSVSFDSCAQSSPSSSCNSQFSFERLQMVEHPYQSSKLRYRADYVREKGRLGALGNKSHKPKLKGPAIRIPECYLSSNNEYYIRVSLVTIKYNKTNLHYFHPYELEHAKNELLNDKANNSVWFPIDSKDSMKNFPLLRIVKKKAFHVQKLDYLRIFDYHSEISQNLPSSEHCVKHELDIIKEYNLEKSQLAFTIGKKIFLNGQSTYRVYPDTTIFSDQMDENPDKQSDTETDTESSSDKTTSPLSSSSSSVQYIYKYAPRSGSIGNADEMLIFLRKKLELKKYGDLQIIFECDISNGHWSESIVHLDIKDRMISFKTPKFPYQIKKPTTVDIVIRQDSRILGVLKYTYLPIC